MSADEIDAGVGWDIGSADRTEWVPWGGGGARAKVLASGDGYHVALVEAAPGYEGGEHLHEHAEMLHVLEGEIVTNGVTMRAGDAYVAAAGSEHRTFTTGDGATYLSIFRI
jgi:mannose-6-phosphate isomerase-like protein (cupin superfamily)